MNSKQGNEGALNTQNQKKEMQARGAGSELSSIATQSESHWTEVSALCGFTVHKLTRTKMSSQAMQYMELIPESQRPVSGTNGALKRCRQLLTQLPIYDQDPMKCQSLASDEEVQ